MNIIKKTIIIRSLRVTYYECGKGKPVLFLHGGRVRALTFKKNLELLSKHYHVIAPDIPGYGESDTPHDIWSFKDYAQFFDDFLSELKIHDVTVIGYSMGGGIALYMAELSSYLSCAVIIDAAGLLEKKRTTLLIPDIKRLFFYTMHPQYVLSLGILLRDYLLYLFRHLSDMKTIQQIRNNSGSIGYKATSSITMSTLILWGKNDWFFPVMHGIKLHKTIPNSQLEIINGNHDWIVYNPELFIGKVILFLKTLQK